MMSRRSKKKARDLDGAIAKVLNITCGLYMYIIIKNSLEVLIVFSLLFLAAHHF